MPDNNGIQYTNPPQSRNEAIIESIIEGTEYTDPPQSRMEDLLLQLKKVIEEGGGGTPLSMFVGDALERTKIAGIFIDTKGASYSSGSWNVYVSEVTAGDKILVGSKFAKITAAQRTKYHYAFYDTVVTSGNYSTIMAEAHCVELAEPDGGKDSNTETPIKEWRNLLTVPEGAACIVVTQSNTYDDSLVYIFKQRSDASATSKKVSITNVSGVTSDIAFAYDSEKTKNLVIESKLKYTGSDAPTIEGKTSLFTSMAYPVGDTTVKENSLRFPYELKGGVAIAKLTVPSGTSVDITELSATFSNERPDDTSGLSLKAHNGVYYMCPENTVPSFEWAGKLGYKRLITQFHVTSDDVIVCIHDDSINSVARNSDGTEISGTVNVADHTYAELNQYDYGIKVDSYFAGTKLATLEEYLDVCVAYDMAPEFSMHVWNIGADNWTAFKSALDSRNLTNKTVFKAFEASALAYAYNVFGNDIYGYGLDVRANASVSDAITALTGLVGASSTLHNFIELDYSDVSAENCATIEAAGYEAHVWDVFKHWTPTDYVTAQSNGISGVTDDWNIETGMKWR